MSTQHPSGDGATVGAKRDRPMREGGDPFHVKHHGGSPR